MSVDKDTPTEVVIIRTGVANIASMIAAFERLGAAPLLTEDREIIADARHLVLPGVGAFGAGMKRLHELGLVDTLRQRLISDKGDKATFCVCLGLQLLCEGSEESTGTEGLGVIPTTVRRFPNTLRVPQLGWNQVAPASPNNTFLTEEGYAYYANSYRIEEVPEGWSGATSTYGAPFVAALERGATLACQFHPELSSAWGQALMRRWLEQDLSPREPRRGRC